MDIQVQNAQRWLNATYQSVPDWVTISEDGITGWEVMYALRRGLQKELGVSPISSGFGPATKSAYQSKVGKLDSQSGSTANLLKLLSASLWCKGFPGLYQGSTIAFSEMSTSVSSARTALGLGPDSPSVDVKMMASLMSMDAYFIPYYGDGTDSVREVQQWLNATYSNRRDFDLIPADGIFSRQSQTALLFAIQFELGLADGSANGNFGPGTRDGLKSQATVVEGNSDSVKRFVRLFQVAMRFNKYSVNFSGSFDSGLSAIVKIFQTFMEIGVTGKGDYTTWCNLLVSSGDTTISTRGFDTNQQLTLAQATGARSKGYTHVGRYTVGEGKFLTSPELDNLRAAGLLLFPLHQRYNNSAATMTYAAGTTQAIEALERCRTLGFPAGSIVYFSVDFDPVGETIMGPVLNFFRGVRETLSTTLNGTYAIGVYGTRNVCQIVLDNGLADGAFVAGMSTGYSGNMGFPMPAGWHYNQIIEVSETLSGSTVAADHDVVSRNARAIDLQGVVSPPIERDNSNTATGFDVVYEWMCRAEVACERSIHSADSAGYPVKQWKISIPEYILNWLRKPKYWDPNYSGLWGKYTPEIDSDQYAVTARAATTQALQSMSPMLPTTGRDVAHFAATAMGYLTWGVPKTPNDYGLGDLGGWMLDLLQAWGAYSRLTVVTDLRSWMESNLGSNDASGFGFNDLVADADGWLICKALQDASPGILSGAGRDLWRMTSAQRLAKFYSERFASFDNNIGTSFALLADGIDAGGVNFPISERFLLAAADADAMPTRQQAEICGQALGSVLFKLST